MNQLKTVAVLLVSALGVFASAQTSPTGQLQQDVETLIQDIKYDVAGSDVTPQEIQAFGAELMTIVSTAYQPNPTYVSELKLTIQTVIQAGTVTSSEKALIAKEVSLVLSSASISNAEISALKNDFITIWTSTNFTKAEAMELVADVKAIIADLPAPTRHP
jgi:hypothetical protein